jgi:hypothetical protein
VSLLIGFHAEGNDALVLCALLAKLLDVDEGAITPDIIDSADRGWNFVLKIAPKALHRFYAKCARAAILCVDNDGNDNLERTGKKEDPRHPRHWNHFGESVERCRYCALERIVETTRPELSWLHPGGQWPVLIAVPVEMIESWLLVAGAVSTSFPGAGDVKAESHRRADQKQRFYGKPQASRQDIEAKALPLLRALTKEQIDKVRQNSQSFRLFAEQVDRARGRILASDHDP